MAAADAEICSPKWLIVYCEEDESFSLIQDTEAVCDKSVLDLEDRLKFFFNNDEYEGVVRAIGGEDDYDSLVARLKELNASNRKREESFHAEQPRKTRGGSKYASALQALKPRSKVKVEKISPKQVSPSRDLVSADDVAVLSDSVSESNDTSPCSSPIPEDIAPHFHLACAQAKRKGRDDDAKILKKLRLGADIYTDSEPEDSPSGVQNPSGMDVSSGKKQEIDNREEKNKEMEADEKLKKGDEKIQEVEEKKKMEAKKKGEAESKKKAEAESKKKAEAESKKKAEAEAKKKAEAEAKKKAEAEAKKKAEAEAKKKAEAEAKKKAEAEAKKKAEAEAKKQIEKEKRHKEKKKKEAEEKLRMEEEEKQMKEERRLRKAERKKKKADKKQHKEEENYDGNAEEEKEYSDKEDQMYEKDQTGDKEQESKETDEQIDTDEEEVQKKKKKKNKKKKSADELLQADFQVLRWSAEDENVVEIRGKCPDLLDKNLFISHGDMQKAKGAKAASTFAKALLVGAFTDEALYKCSVSGGQYRAGGRDKMTRKPPLPADIVAVILDNAMYRQACKKWSPALSKKEVLAGLRQKLVDVRPRLRKQFECSN